MKKNALRLPAWVCREEPETPIPNGHDRFLTRSLLRFLATLHALRRQAQQGQVLFSALASLSFVLPLLVLIAASHRLAFLFAVLAPILGMLALQDGTTILRLLKPALFAALCSFLLVLPAMFLFAGALFFLLPCKAFLSTLLVALLAQSFPWQNLTAALHRLGLPNALLFLLDTTLRAIYLLGQTAEELLLALKLRSVGRNTRQRQSLGNIVGVTFLKSEHLTEETLLAMRCRCFVGTYGTRKEKLQRWDMILLILSLAYLLLFLRTEAYV